MKSVPGHVKIKKKATIDILHIIIATIFNEYKYNRTILGQPLGRVLSVYYLTQSNVYNLIVYYYPILLLLLLFHFTVKKSNQGKLNCLF